MAVQKVNGVSLSELESWLGESFDSIKAQVRQLQQTIDNLEGRWQGVGASAFDQKQRLINEDVVALGNMLNGLKNSIHDTRSLSGNTDDDVLQRMKGISVDGGLASSAGPDTTQSSLASKLNQY